MKRNYIFLIILIAFCFSLQTIAYSQEYYADNEITIDSTGNVLVKGISNSIFINNASNIYTSKNKDVWTFKLIINDTFSDYILKIQLPKNSELTYLKSSGKPYVSYDSVLVVTEIGKDKPIDIIIQYKMIGKEPYTARDFLVGGAVIIFVTMGLIVFLKFSSILKKKSISVISKNIESLQKKPIDDNMTDFLTNRQKEIVNILVKNNGKLSQSQIEKSLNIPKSSVSRNIDSLKFKGIVEKINKGNINLIILKIKN